MLDERKGCGNSGRKTTQGIVHLFGAQHQRLAEARSVSLSLVRFARLMGKATRVMESESGARAWLTNPQFRLGGAVPLRYAETEIGAREVEDLLGRIEHGVYS